MALLAVLVVVWFAVDAKRCKQGFFDIRRYSSYAAGLPR
jgi:hypothetical protein